MTGSLAFRLSPRRFALVAVAAAGFGVACAPQPIAVQSPLVRFGGRCEVTAAHHEDWQITQQAASVLEASGYCHYQIPEYHDEQQLSDGDNGLGPLVKVFASPNTGTISDHTPFDGQWVNVAILLRDPGPVPPTYDELGLQPERTCMYLRHLHSGAQDNWEAIVVAVPPSGVCEASATRLSGRVLVVQAERPMPNVSDYPAVARFVEVRRGNQPHTMIGVRCGDRWCSAGAVGSQIPPHAHDGMPGAGNSARWRVKGWFDDQTLSVPASGTGPPGLRRALRASIVPVDDLATLTTDSFRGVRRHVATVMVPMGIQIPPKYADPVNGYGFVNGANRIELTFDGSDWRAYIVNSAHTAGLAKDVLRVGHEAYGIPVPGTARWRWSPTDEQIWVRCDVGCCRVIENQS